LKNSRLDFKKAVQEFSGMAYSLAFRILDNRDDAKDAVQQAFLKLYRNKDKYLKNKNLKNWIYTITLNTARDFYRKKKRHLEMEIFENTAVSGTDNREHKVEDGLFTQKLVNLLPFDLREVVVLYYLEQMSIKEVSSMLDITENLVKVRLYRARKKLIETYEKLK
jgi:RNA polymerase sigma-70 factor (ECF subfamily)